jgi:hypothetical protein
MGFSALSQSMRALKLRDYNLIRAAYRSGRTYGLAMGAPVALYLRFDDGNNIIDHDKCIATTHANTQSTPVTLLCKYYRYLTHNSNPILFIVISKSTIFL